MKGHRPDRSAGPATSIDDRQDDGTRRRSLLSPPGGDGNCPGQEIEHPMVVVILRPLVTSTPLNLLFVRALRWRFGKSRSRMRRPYEMP